MLFARHPQLTPRDCCLSVRSAVSVRRFLTARRVPRVRSVRRRLEYGHPRSVPTAPRCWVPETGTTITSALSEDRAVRPRRSISTERTTSRPRFTVRHPRERGRSPGRGPTAASQPSPKQHPVNVDRQGTHRHPLNGDRSEVHVCGISARSTHHVHQRMQTGFVDGFFRRRYGRDARAPKPICVLGDVAMPLRRPQPIGPWTRSGVTPARSRDRLRFLRDPNTDVRLTPPHAVALVAAWLRAHFRSARSARFKRQLRSAWSRRAELRESCRTFRRSRRCGARRLRATRRFVRRAAGLLPARSSSEQ